MAIKTIQVTNIEANQELKKDRNKTGGKNAIAGILLLFAPVLPLLFFIHQRRKDEPSGRKRTERLSGLSHATVAKLAWQ